MHIYKSRLFIEMLLLTRPSDSLNSTRGHLGPEIPGHFCLIAGVSGEKDTDIFFVLTIPGS